MERLWLGSILTFIAGWVLVALGVGQAGGPVVYAATAVLVLLAVVWIGRLGVRGLRH